MHADGASLFQVAFNWLQARLRFALEDYPRKWLDCLCHGVMAPVSRALGVSGGLDTLAAAVGTETAAATAVVPCSPFRLFNCLFACLNSEQTIEAVTAMTRPHCAVA